jgi:ATP-dependent RNA helicase DeaD
MLDLGFSEDLEMILDATPETRRTLMFSATVSKGIAQLAKKYQTDAQRITTLADKDQHADIEYHAIQVNQHDAENAIINTLRYHEAPNAIVFANTRATVARLTTRLSNRGFSVVCLSGELSQSERSHALQAMRDGRARICVATDVAARGIDLPKLDLVVHAELPSNHETLLHRSGRTGRAGRKGTSVLIVPPNAYRKATRILGSAKLNADWRPAPTADEVLSKDHERMLHDDIWTNEINPNHADMVETLLTQFGAERVAAAFLETYSKHMSAPEDISEFSAKPSKRDGKREPKSHADFGPSTWFKLAKGRNDGVSPGQIVPMLCKAGGITKSDIGAIRIQDKHTFLELRQEAQDGFMSTLGSDPKVEGAPIAALDAAPDLPPPPPRGASGGKPHRGSGGGRGFGGKSDGPRRSDRGDKPARGDKFHPIGAPNDAPKPERAKDRPKRFDKPTSPSNPAKERPEGVVTPIKKKPRKSAGPDGGFDPKSPQSSKRAGARKPAGTGLAPKVGKFNSKKNKARRTDGAPSGKGGFSAPKRTK